LAKKKPRTPPPPRVQAPQRRGGGGGGGISERRARLLLYGAAVAGPIVLATVLGVIFLGGGGGDVPSGKQSLAPGCTLRKYKLLNGTHVSSFNSKVKWNSWPPTSGPHYFSPAAFNFYEEKINPRLTLHNLEHGGVDIFWGKGVPTSEIEQLRSFWRESPNAIVVAPLPSLDQNITVPKPIPNYANKIVAAAWTSTPYSNSGSRTGQKGNGYLLTCSRFDENTFKQFRDIHRGKGPERFPVNLLSPGA
jgi:Protein of unknown function (DUF3105)